MSSHRPLRLGFAGIVLLAALLVLIFAAPQVTQPPLALAGVYYNCPGGAGAVQISSGATCSNLYPSCYYGGCPAQCNIGSCLQACSTGYTAAGCSLAGCASAYSASCGSYAQSYCSALGSYGYGGYGGSQGCSSYNCGQTYAPYGCTVRPPSNSCVGSVNNPVPQCGGSGACAAATVNNPAAVCTPSTAGSACGVAYAASSCGGVIVCAGGQLASAASGCSVTPNSGPTGVNGVGPSDLQTCSSTGAPVTSQSQCPVSCSNGQVLPPGTPCPAGSTAPGSTSTVTGSNGPAPAGATVSLKAGWNLASFPTGTQVNGSDAPVYALPPGSSAYQTLTNAGSAPAGQGYWLHMPSANQITLAQVGAGSVTVQLPAGQSVLIGNPGDAQATVAGADAVWVYDPVAGWTQTTTLNPGQGAFAESVAGGTATITYGAASGLPS